jgi:serine/threonine protein kinase
MPPLIGGRRAVESAGFRVRWEQPIAHGEMGVIYAGVNAKTGQNVVVKQTSREDEGRIQAAASRRSKYIPDVFLDTSEGACHYIVMEQGGEPLRGQLGHKLETHHAVHLVRNILEALKAIHEEGYLHLDDHPLNVLQEMLDPETIRLIDYGGAVPMHDGKGQSTAFHGLWRAPEMLGPSSQQVTVGPPADLYSVGLILGKALTGKLPITIPKGQLENYELRREAAKRPDVSGVENQALRDVLLKALAFDPEQRYATAQAFIDALAPWPPHARGAGWTISETPTRAGA